MGCQGNVRANRANRLKPARARFAKAIGANEAIRINRAIASLSFFSGHFLVFQGFPFFSKELGSSAKSSFLGFLLGRAKGEFALLSRHRWEKQKGGLTSLPGEVMVFKVNTSEGVIGAYFNKLNGTNGFLQKSAVFCKNLRFPADFCENLRLQML